MAADKEQQVRYISQRLSLRPPQLRSLEILADLDARLEFKKAQDLEVALTAARNAYPSVQDFEREFPSFCFALATGVGKTRLMGAFIAYLHRTGRSHHFFILAPNLTIYDKLIRDFTPGHPHYVLAGLDVFATTPPIIVTGENYQDGAGIRRSGVLPGVVRADEAHINIFNISKISSESRGGKEPRIKRLSEYIGQSYFEYLAALPDLVLLMDEAHRYRADAGMKAINELKPIVGLELTATAHTERSGKTTPFRNIAYHYPLSQAIDDGFVKSPAVLTRRDFQVGSYGEAELERLKLEDGLKLHEAVKVKLQVYAHEEAKPLVKPFALVVAKDTTHAERLKVLIEGDGFFGGSYKGKVITVHSNQGASESDDVVQKLLKVEETENPVEVVIHVNMLKEGWDVRNLYTIIPLRTADARTLVEQTIGRGLRLPFGKRTGIKELDRLTIVAHDNFQKIVEEARRPGSAIQMEAIEVDPQSGPPASVKVESAPVALAELGQVPPTDGSSSADVYTQDFLKGTQIQHAADAVLKEMSQVRAPSLEEWRKPERVAQLVQAVERATLPAQAELEGVTPPKVDAAAVAARVIEILVANTIQIPRVIVGLKPGVEGRYRDFDLNLVPFPALQPVAHDILIQSLRDGDQSYLNDMGDGVVKEKQPEAYLVRKLMDLDGVNYDRDAALLHKLAGQAVAHYRELLKTDDALHNVLLNHARFIAQKVAEQMDRHYEEPQAEFEASCSGGYTMAPIADFESDSRQILPLRAHVEPLSSVPKKVFGPLKKCMYQVQRFDSNPERVLAIVLENDASVLRWVRPVRDLLRIHVSGGTYKPDFVVETATAKWVIEVKASNEMNDPEVKEKAAAGRRWCEAATQFDGQGKAWAYVMVKAEAVHESLSFDGLKNLG